MGITNPQDHGVVQREPTFDEGKAFTVCRAKEWTRNGPRINMRRETMEGMKARAKMTH
jgi:hypothetical protein